ncbi:hypothetical protein ACFPU1_03630 [Thalassorhabdus alkalitolerans]|uniref:Thiazolylpeptide-type bacteriocin n=1 Tax=Thalassorhabdus alkalitolerans TaxID=2282697 RepID=A0ABW0YM88_9BACI|nr:MULTISPECIES: hypothetical protein [Bacillaceae]
MKEINGLNVAIEEQIVSHVDTVTLDVEADMSGNKSLTMKNSAGSDCC